MGDKKERGHEAANNFSRRCYAVNSAMNHERKSLEVDMMSCFRTGCRLKRQPLGSSQEDSNGQKIASIVIIFGARIRDSPSCDEWSDDGRGKRQCNGMTDAIEN